MTARTCALSLMAGTMLWAAASQAQAPSSATATVPEALPAPDAAAPLPEAATLCGVTGLVQAVMQEEMVSPMGENAGQRVMVPVIVLQVQQAVPVDPAYQGDFCSRVTAPAAPGGLPMGYYRLCDPVAEFMTGQKIRAVVGASQGGGRYCIAQIQLVPPA